MRSGAVVTSKNKRSDSIATVADDLDMSTGLPWNDLTRLHLNTGGIGEFDLVPRPEPSSRRQFRNLPDQGRIKYQHKIKRQRIVLISLGTNLEVYRLSINRRWVRRTSSQNKERSPEDQDTSRVSPIVTKCLFR